MPFKESLVLSELTTKRMHWPGEKKARFRAGLVVADLLIADFHFIRLFGEAVRHQYSQASNRQS